MIPRIEVADPLLAVIAVVLLALLLAVGTTTLVWSVVSARRDRRRHARRPEIKTGVLERLGRTDPDWETWVEGFDATDRAVARDVLLEYLRRLEGEDARSLQAFAAALDIEAWATGTLDSGDHYDRLRALTWLAMLRTNIDPSTLVRTCSDHPDERAAAARVLYAQDHPEAASAGTELLLSATGSLSVLGLDTLYRLNESDPDPLIDRASDAYGVWSESLLIQVLDTVAETGPASTDVSLDWIGFLFVNESARVRAAAAGAVADYGWRSELRAVVDVDQIRDDVPAVRRPVYLTLGEWNDEPSLDALEAGLRGESDGRSAVVAARALRRTNRSPYGPLPPTAGRAVEWVRANERIQVGGGR